MADMDNVFGYDYVMEEQISAVTDTASVDLGTKVRWKGEDYVYAYNAGNVQVQPSYGCRIVTGASGYSFDGATEDDVVQDFLGVVKHATITTGAYGWVMFNGFVNVEGAADSTITGDCVALALSADGTFHQQYPVTDAVHVGTFNCVGYGKNVDTASGGSFYARFIG